MPCHYYPPADLDELEEIATEATPDQQREALQMIADVFHHHQLPYGLMGGMNFYFRGSSRTTDDVDLAVTGSQSLQATLDLLNDAERVTRPRNKMSWMGGVARTFIQVGKQQVQIDLKWQKSEGHGMPMDLNAATEVFQLVEGHRTGVRFLKIGPLVRAKFQSYGRGKPGDYVDLIFTCKHPQYREDVRNVADKVSWDRREMFLHEVLQTDPGEEDSIRHILKLGSVCPDDTDLGAEPSAEVAR
ncbi:hypothetical protein C8A00DRAFT_16135 [Chaetomidium leptoderma]|uniref:Uncharacterized protein n=1 Tax=Chaetomidium leptoderma TaxID=669021 RepID=A0AAN6VJQ5_9PEZI|nr:hypothetical protein C8A00DRAFT_16135 [Chaetomidium leptoderma]